MPHTGRIPIKKYQGWSRQLGYARHMKPAFENNAPVVALGSIGKDAKRCTADQEGDGIMPRASRLGKNHVPGRKEQATLRCRSRLDYA